MSPEELEIEFNRRDFIILQRGSLILAESIGMEKVREEVARNLPDILDDATVTAKTSLSAAQVKLLRLLGYCFDRCFL